MPLRFRILAPSSSPSLSPSRRTTTTVAALDLATGPSEDRTFELTSEPAEIRVGRQPGSEIELPFPGVSLAHARLFRGESPAEWWLEDLASTNGTCLDGELLRARRPVVLRTGQRLRIATVDVVFEGWSAIARGDPSTGTIARRLISDLFGASGGEVAILAVEVGPAYPEQLRLEERERRYVAGRADTCDLVLPSEQVSREHAAFVRRWEGVFVDDLGSRHGVRVNGLAVSGWTHLGDGDRIDVGVTTLRLTDPEDRYLARLAALDEAALAAAAEEGEGGSDGGGGEDRDRDRSGSRNRDKQGAKAVARSRSRVPTPGIAHEAVALPVEGAGRPRRSGKAIARRSEPAVPTVARARPSKRTLTMLGAAVIVVLAVAALIALLTTWG